jgi:predicted DsbA family dithiol-disulfide isomerase
VTRPAVEVFADVVCPFAHVGLRRILRRRAELGSALPVLRVRAWPLELVNGAPLDPGVVAQHVEELREQIEPDLFRGFHAAALPSSSLPSLALVAHAYQANDELGEQVSLAVRDALFEEGLDVADPAVLAAIAASHDLPPAGPDAEQTVLADLEEGKRRGVRGSPEFFLDDRGYFCPALRIDNIDGKLEIAPDSEAFDTFLADCLS